MLSNASENPYKPAAIQPTKRPSHPRWLRRIVTLNCGLILLLLILGVFAFVSLQMEIAREAASHNAPTIVHDFHLELSPLFFLYFVIPNLILLGWTGIQLQKQQAD